MTRITSRILTAAIAYHDSPIVKSRACADVASCNCELARAIREVQAENPNLCSCKDISCRCEGQCARDGHFTIVPMDLSDLVGKKMCLVCAGHALISGKFNVM